MVGQKPGFLMVGQKPGFLMVGQKPGFLMVGQKPGFLKKPGFLNIASDLGLLYLKTLQLSKITIAFFYVKLSLVGYGGHRYQSLSNRQLLRAEAAQLGRPNV